MALGAAFALAACTTAPPGAAPDIDRLTASEIANGICSGAFTSEAATHAYVERAKSLVQHNAFVTFDEAGVMRAAREADARRAGACRPLQGVPIVVKDNLHVAGLPSTAGTPALAKFVPDADAPVVQRLREAGAIVMGKTNMHELAFGISGYNPAFNTGPYVGVRNAYDITRMPGGSSAGTAVAIGARMAPAGLGTDTGGSVRIPCALNGCASLRPTVGRYPQAGIAPISHTRDTAGPMAVSMADIELMDRVISGAPQVVPANLRGVRIGVANDFLANLDGDTKAAYDAAIAKLTAAGAAIVPVTMPKLGDLNNAVSFPIALYEAYDDMVAYLSTYHTGVTIEQLAAQIASPDVKGTYLGLVIPRVLPVPSGGVTPAAPIYRAAMATNRPALQKLYADTFAANRIEALIFPTVPHVALLANPDSSSLPNFLLFIQNTDPGSNAGVPGINVPMGMVQGGRMPAGIELDGPAGSDRRLVAIGMAVEQVLGRVPAAR
ncbi:MAG TPA: indoleacetamide hydrolase [Ramlibacter sp.]